MNENGNETVETPAAPRPARWPWVLGIAVLVVVAVWLLKRSPPEPPPKVGSQPELAVIEPLPIRVAAELQPADAVPGPSGRLKGCNLLLVTLDTVRADRLGCYGNEAIETPAVDGLARHGVLFSRAVAPAPTTAPSHASILTGLYSHHHGVRTNGLFRLADTQVTLAEVLAGSGYATAGVVSAFILDAQFGFAQGFDYFDDLEGEQPIGQEHIPERPADQTAERAITWLRAHAGEPFFLWVHFFDPHYPYQPPDPFSAKYADLPYDGEIAFADAELAGVLGVVEELGLTNRTLVIVAGDHGEGLGQHGEPRHGYLLYDSTLHVPLVMSCGDRLGSGLHVSRRVSLMDLMPTALSLLGIEAPSPVDGVDLTEPPGAPRPLFAETLHGRLAHGWSSLFAVYDGPEGMNKYIYGPEPELYDLSADPFERNSLASSRKQVAADLERRLASAFGAQLDESGPVEPTVKLSAQDVAKLESLGYIGMNNAAEPVTPASHPDPKKMLALKAQVDAVMERASSPAKLQSAVAELKGLVQAHPDFEPAYVSLGECYQRAGDLDSMEAAYRRANELRPDTPHTLLALARIRTTRGDFESAAAIYRKLLSLYPDHYEALIGLGYLLSVMGRFDEAIEPLEGAYRVVPDYGRVREALADALFRVGRGGEAVALLERELERDPAAASVRNSLGRLLVQMGDNARAIAVLRQGLTLAPNQPQLANNLALLLANCADESLRDPPEAVSLAEAVCQATQRVQPDYLLTLAIAYSAAQQPDDALAAAQEALRVAQSAGRAQLAQTIGKYLDELLRGNQAQTATAPATQPAP